MRATRLPVILFAAALVCGCTTGVYFVSRRPAQAEQELYRYKASDGSDASLGPAYQGARAPHIAFDGSLLYIKSVAGTYQVFRGSQQLTTSSGDKDYPRWSPNWLAFEQTGSVVLRRQPPDFGPSNSIVLRSHDGATEFTLATPAFHGLAFVGGGQRVAFADVDGIYLANAAPNAGATRVAACPTTTPPSDVACDLPTVSHDGTMLAYRWRAALGPGNIASRIRILRIGTWSETGSINRTLLDDSIPGVSTVDLMTFEFSPDDEWLYVTAIVRTPSGPAPTRPELFRMKRDGTQAARLLGNQYPNYSPTAKRIWIWE